VSKSGFMKKFVHPSASVESGAVLGDGVRIWRWTHVQSGACLEDDVSVGQGCFVGAAVILGKGTRVQNSVSIFEGVLVGENVFIGPSVTFTNVTNPRAALDQKECFQQTIVGEGATIGANATVLCGTNLGEYCFIGCGAVILRDVPAYALVVGNPGKHIGWVNRNGQRLDLPHTSHVRMELEDAGVLYILKGDKLTSRPI